MRQGGRRRVIHRVVVGAAVAAIASSFAGIGFAGSAGASTPQVAAPRTAVTWMHGFDAPGTPARYNTVGVLKIGPARAKNVLVLEPGTSAGSAYFAPLARWIVTLDPGWQVWSVERRENLLEDQTQLNAYKQGTINSTQLFNYYLGYLKDPGITQHFQLIPDASVAFAKQWGMQVAVGDLHTVIKSARKLGGHVVLGGHSLGGSVVTAYATWDFHGHAGAKGLDGLVYIDGGSDPTPLTSAQATAELQALDAPAASPWLSFGGIGAPFAGVFNATGSAAALLDPRAPSLGQSSGLLPANIVPPVPVTNLGQYGFALNVATSPPSLIAAQAHLGQGVAARGPVHGWDGKGRLTPIERYATMFSGAGILNTDGTEWYFPHRLTDDTGAVANGNANAAQSVMDVHATMGHHLPSHLLIYAFGAQLGGQSVLTAAQLLAQQSRIPSGNLTLVNEFGVYAHNDPAGAYPKNVFVDNLVPFLHKVSSRT